jgi:hypothetical protein
MYVFGGEFSSPNQERFMHFRWGRGRGAGQGGTGAGGRSSGGRPAGSGTRPEASRQPPGQRQKPIVEDSSLRGPQHPTHPPPPPRLTRDLWRLDLATHEWDNLPTRGGPSARSGHRMALHKNKAILFGGFYDTGAEVK